MENSPPLPLSLRSRLTRVILRLCLFFLLGMSALLAFYQYKHPEFPVLHNLKHLVWEIRHPEGVPLTSKDLYAAGYKVSELVTPPPEPGSLTGSEQALAVSLLESGDYDRLEAMLSEFRRSGDGTAGGVTKIIRFYALIASGGLDNADDNHWKIRIDALTRWGVARPGKKEPAIALARCYIGYAWRARGEGWADSVSQEAWARVNDRLNLASRALGTVVETGPECPGYYNCLMMIGHLSGWSDATMGKVMMEGICRHPYCGELFHHRLIHLLPRWHGKSPDDWLHFAEKASGLVGGRQGDMLYARLVWDAVDYGEAVPFAAPQTRVDWPKLKRGFEALLVQYPDSSQTMAAYCMASFMRGRSEFDTTLAMFRKLGPRYVSSVWPTPEKYLAHRHYILSHYCDLPASDFSQKN